MELADLRAEADRLIFPRFAEPEAWRLGMILVALSEGLPVVINIRTPDRTLFHAALPGASADNDRWARRKSNTALLMGKASFQIGTELRAKGETLDARGLSPIDYADAGGAVPIRVRGVGVVACATVSGLPQAEDHALVVRAMDQLLQAI